MDRTFVPIEELVQDGVRYYYLSAAEISDDQVREAAGLLVRAFEGWPRPAGSVAAADHLRWKLSKPGERQPMLGLIDVGDGVVGGVSVLIPRTYRLRGTPIQMADWADAAIAPGLQGRGLYSTRREYIKGMDHYFVANINFSLHPQILRIRRRLGESTPPANELRTLVRPLVPTRAARDQRGGRWQYVPAPLLGIGATALSALARLRYRGQRMSEPGVTIGVLERFDDRLDALFARTAPRFQFIQQRDAETLNWRYVDPRAGRFEVLAAESAGELRGYAVVAPREDRVVLADLLGDRDSVVSMLIEAATRYARATGAAALTCWLPRHHPYRALMAAHGLIGGRVQGGINVRPIALSPEDEAGLLHDPRFAIHLMHGDLDAV